MNKRTLSLIAGVLSFTTATVAYGEESNAQKKEPPQNKPKAVEVKAEGKININDLMPNGKREVRLENNPSSLESRQEEAKKALNEVKKLLSIKEIEKRTAALERKSQQQEEKLIQLIVKNRPFSEEKKLKIEDTTDKIVNDFLQERLNDAWNIVFINDDPGYPKISYTKLKRVIDLTFQNFLKMPNSKKPDEMVYKPIPTKFEAANLYCKYVGYDLEHAGFDVKITPITLTGRSIDINLVSPTPMPEDKVTEIKREIHGGADMIMTILGKALSTNSDEENCCYRIMRRYARERDTLPEKQEGITSAAELLKLGQIRITLITSLNQLGLPIPKNVRDYLQSKVEQYNEMVEKEKEKKEKEKKQEQKPTIADIVTKSTNDITH